MSHTLLWCCLPLAAFAAAAYPLSGWLIDDAGISFAYARNLAAGEGLVSQPGRTPVEGFSNPLWTLMFVPGFWLSSSAPVWFAKFLGHLFAFGVFVFGFLTLLRITQSALLGLMAMLFLALNTSFVVWSVSGLENALYGFAIAGIVYLGLVTLERPSLRVAVAAGLLASTAALTRPDGMIFVVLWPAALCLYAMRDWRVSGTAVRATMLYVAAAVLPFIVYKGAAFLYFGNIFPNTYYAKGGPGLNTVLDILRLDSAIVAKASGLLAGPFGFAWLAITVFIATFLICVLTRRLTAPLVFLCGASVLALVAYLLLPTDWMGEFRFGTPFLVLFYPALFSLLWVAAKALPQSRFVSRQFPALVLIAVFAAASILVHQIRFSRFYAEPTVPFAQVSQLYGDRFNRTAEILGIEQGSFLLPDLGGTLFYSDLTIFDLAGLTDPTIARTLGRDTEGLHDYIFNELKPTFIHTHEYWARASDFHSNPTFREQYVPLRESIDEAASAAAGRDMLAGDYVRKDAIRGGEEALSQARQFLYGAR